MAKTLIFSTDKNIANHRRFYIDKMILEYKVDIEKELSMLLKNEVTGVVLTVSMSPEYTFGGRDIAIDMTYDDMHIQYIVQKYNPIKITNTSERWSIVDLGKNIQASTTYKDGALENFTIKDGDITKLEDDLKSIIRELLYKLPYKYL